MKEPPTLMLHGEPGPLASALIWQLAPFYRLAIAHGNRQEGNRQCQALHEQGHQALYLECTAGNDADLHRAMTRLLRRWQRLDWLVNLPAELHAGPFEGVNREGWHHLLQQQVMTTVSACQQATSIMKRQGQGHIINVIYDHGLLPQPLLSAQSTCHGAVAAFSESLHGELSGLGITVRLISLPLHASLQDNLQTTDPLTRARLVRRLEQSDVTSEELAAETARLLVKKTGFIRFARAASRRQWRQKRWFSGRWYQRLREMGERVRRR